ncbi:DNA polymerase [Achromobacter kerstersii]|uniref:DNA polymerase n=1 Tax=Achromobacter kerstersii TaxID=1353890 RepID=UPI0006C662A3|nr:DNA polymerase [Achromobacter kerstersii]CUI27256.1 DNA polymerase I%2C thermostable [Achromobacter kerstersii]
MVLGNFTAVWVVDYEFRAYAGERPAPVCMVAHDIISGNTLRQWFDAATPAPCPFGTGDDTLFVAYYASAEMGCHLALGWPMPKHVLDLYAEFRVETNGRVLPSGNGLLGALTHYGEQGIEALEKDAMRQLILRGEPYSTEEQAAIFDYCDSDVVATVKLLRKMWLLFNDPQRLGFACNRGRYAKAVAHMEWNGIPMDADLLDKLRTHWDALKDRLIARVDAHYGVYEGRTFKHNKFVAYLAANGIAWPTLASGRLALDDDTFSEQCKSHPELRPLKELRQAMGQLRLNELPVGQDDRNRTLLSMFSAKTGRNQPSNSKFVFGLSAWLRGLIKPKPGFGLAYVDWSQQEFGIAAALSGDKAMQEAYASGDPYLTFAKQAGAAPADATKSSHAAIREQYKACTLAVQYGMQEESLAKRIQQPVVYAREMLKMHRRTYPVFWAWSDSVMDYALTQRRLWTVFGWMLHVDGKSNGRSLRNFPMQANGAEMLRLACCLATEAGLRVAAPVHDAALIEAPLGELDAAAAQMQTCMRLASAQVLRGFELRSDAKLITAPDRYADERGRVMWQTVNELLDGMTTGVEA